MFRSMRYDVEKKGFKKVDFFSPKCKRSCHSPSDLMHFFVIFKIDKSGFLLSSVFRQGDLLLIFIMLCLSFKVEGFGDWSVIHCF